MPDTTTSDRCPSCLCEDCKPSPYLGPLSCSLASFKPPARIAYLAEQLAPLLSAHLSPKKQRRCLAVAHAAHHALIDYDYPEGRPDA